MSRKTIGQTEQMGIPKWLLDGIGFDTSLGVPFQVYIKASARSVLEADVDYLPCGSDEVETVTCPEHTDTQRARDD